MIFNETLKVETPSHFLSSANLTNEHWDALYRQASENRDVFFEELAKNQLAWKKPFSQLHSNCENQVTWFADGELNASEQCLEVPIRQGLGNKLALVWEGELCNDSGLPTERIELSYHQLQQEVVAFARGLRAQGVCLGDRVVIYMPLIPASIVAMLACARIGAIHSVVFGGFSAESLRDRISDAQAKFVVCADGGYRRGKKIDLLANVRSACQALASSSSHQSILEKVFVFQRCSEPPSKNVGSEQYKEITWGEVIEAGQSAQACITDERQWVKAEHPLFILYTSGTTGKPKGVVHSTAGYLLWAKQTTQWVFDLKPADKFWCTADIGWITGHTYVVYGPLSNGATVFLYEGAPDFPDFSRFWKIIEREKITCFYTAPTAIRALMRQGNSIPRSCNLSSLRLLGSVGEPINPEAWHWYHEIIGNKNCPIVDTWWQTETGGIMMSVLPSRTAAKPGCAMYALPGIEMDIVNDNGLPVEQGETGKLVQKTSWPSQLRTVWGNHQRFCETYYTQFRSHENELSKTLGWYFTGDGAYRDKEGDIWITGRVDDVINVAGHRIGTMEIESALVEHESIAEAAVVGVPHEVKGTSIYAFVILMKECKEDAKNPAACKRITEELKEIVTQEVGSFAKPEFIRFSEALPKTRSGKIMRRLLRDVATGHDALGDTSTLEDVSVLGGLKNYQEEC